VDLEDRGNQSQDSPADPTGENLFGDAGGNVTLVPLPSMLKSRSNTFIALVTETPVASAICTRNAWVN